jgi:MoaA/NifB/PqqE/SkfB family radical SAM enzyme
MSDIPLSIDQWFEQKKRSAGRDEAFSGWELLGRKIRGIVSWNMNDSCNYRCTYCTQRNMVDRSGVLEGERFQRALDSFSRLPGSWEIKLSGGEPFRQPELIEITRQLVAQGHCISVQTNFSATEDRIQGFLESTRGALNLFSASLHLEYDKPESFLAKYRWIQPYEKYGVRFHVTSVAVPHRLPQLRDEIAPFFKENGIVFKVQPEKQDGYVREYSREEKGILLELGGHNLTGQIANNFQGRLCRAGANYLVVKSTGRAYRCYPASRLGGKFAECGTLEDGFHLLDGPAICPYTYCNCTVPIQRGMIEGYIPPLETKGSLDLEE